MNAPVYSFSKLNALYPSVERRHYNAVIIKTKWTVKESRIVNRFTLLGQRIIDEQIFFRFRWEKRLRSVVVEHLSDYIELSIANYINEFFQFSMNTGRRTKKEERLFRIRTRKRARRIIGFLATETSTVFCLSLITKAMDAIDLSAKTSLDVALKARGYPSVSVIHTSGGYTIVDERFGRPFVGKSAAQVEHDYVLTKYHRDIRQINSFPRMVMTEAGYNVKNSDYLETAATELGLEEWALNEISLDSQSETSFGQLFESVGRLTYEASVGTYMCHVGLDLDSTSDHKIIEELIKRYMVPSIIGNMEWLERVMLRLLGATICLKKSTSINIVQNEITRAIKIVCAMDDTRNTVEIPASAKSKFVKPKNTRLRAIEKSELITNKGETKKEVLSGKQTGSIGDISLGEPSLDKLVLQITKWMRHAKGEDTQITRTLPLVLNHFSLLNEIAKVSLIKQVDIISEEILGSGLKELQPMFSKAIITDNAAVAITAGNFKHKKNKQMKDGTPAEFLSLMRDGVSVRTSRKQTLRGNIVQIRFDGFSVAITGSSRIVRSDAHSMLDLNDVHVYSQGRREDIDNWITLVNQFTSPISFADMHAMLPITIERSSESVNSSNNSISYDFRRQVANLDNGNTKLRMQAWIHYHPDHIEQGIKITRVPYFALEFKKRRIIVLDTFCKNNGLYVFYDKSLRDVIRIARGATSRHEIIALSSLGKSGYHTGTPAQTVRAVINRKF